MPALVVIATLVSLVATAPASASWQRPVAGDVRGDFTYSTRTPFAAGQRRGVDLAAQPGKAVAAACGGRVTYAGPVPRRGLGVTVRCGRLVATHLGLGRTLVRRGARVRAGSAIGTAGPFGTLRLGARLAGRPLAYVDPLELVAPGRIPLGPAPGPRPRPLAPRRMPPARFVPPRPQAPRGLPPAAWAGLALLACGLPASVARRWARSTSQRRSTTSTPHLTSGTRIRRSRPT